MRVLVALLMCGLLLAPAIPAPAAVLAETAEKTYCDVALLECRARCADNPTLTTTAALLGSAFPLISGLYNFFVSTCSEGCVLSYQECSARYQNATGTPA